MSLEENASPTPSRHVHIETWGCQMNVSDSEKMMASLAKKDYTLVSDAKDADLIVLNTCHIREKSRHKVVSRLGVLKELKAARPHLRIAVTGCVAEAEGKNLLKAAPSIDILVGPGQIHRIAEMVDASVEKGEKAIALGFSKKARPLSAQTDSACHDAFAPEMSGVETEEAPRTLDGRNEVSRFLTIQEGCNNFCTFCVVPFTRGGEVSQTPQKLVAAAKALVKLGAQEITLLGQNVNSYGLDLFPDSGERTPFVHLIEEMAKIEGIKRLRYTTSNPHDFTKPLAELFRTEPKLGAYLHLPVQSGSNRVLEAMRRKVSREVYLEKIAWLREMNPEMAISTDLIVAFPGETDEDFADTLDLVDQARFSFAYSFIYSPRKKTAAARMRGQIPPEEAKARLALLNAKLQGHTKRWHEAEVGRVRETLFLYKSQKEPDIYYGRSQEFRLVRVRSGRDLVGKLAQVRILTQNLTALEGELV